MRLNAIWSSSSRLYTDSSVPSSKYWYNRPLVFSLLPRCQGLCGSVNYTATPVRKVNAS